MRPFLTIAVAAGATLALMGCGKPANEAPPAMETTTAPVTPSDSPPPPSDATTVPPVAPPPTDPTRVPPDVIAPPPGEAPKGQ